MVEIKFKDEIFVFKKYDTFWMASMQSNSDDATFEVYHEHLNKEVILKILAFLLSEKYTSFEVKSVELLSNLSAQFWGEDVKNPLFRFAGITLSDFEKDIDFQIVFHMSCNDCELHQDFANWIIDVKDFKIIGAFREQL